MSSLEDVLSPGQHTIKATFSGSVYVEKGEKITLAEAIDQALTGASLDDWELDGE